MAMSAKEYDEAHNYIKEALTSQPKNVELRGLYTYFLVETGTPKAASDFTLDTLKSHNRHDVYALCATGMLTYIRVRENKEVSKEADQDRATRYLRTAEYFEKALTLDPQCAFAAQGLAISIAEGTLGTGIEGTPNAPVTDHAQKAKNSRDALTILTKVKGSINNGSVYINIGHCHFMRDEWERAIESVSALFDFPTTSPMTDLSRLFTVRDSFQKILRWKECQLFTLLVKILVSQR